METNEIMTTTETDVEAAEGTTVGFEPNTLGKVLIGGAAALVVGAVGFVVGKICKKKKAIKEQQEILDADDTEVEDEVTEIE